MPNDIKNKIWNIELVVQEIKSFPQTYKTILAEECGNGTCQIVLRRKLNSLVKDGTICKTSIPGTRFGKAIFYTIPKPYEIIVKAGRTGSTVYCFFKYKKQGTYYIILDECWGLEKGEWKKKNNVSIFGGSILLWI